jgi:hypothetical protein
MEISQKSNLVFLILNMFEPLSHPCVIARYSQNHDGKKSVINRDLARDYRFD